MKIPLIAGFHQKEIVKKEGAKWDIDNKTWYIEEERICANLYQYLPIKYHPDKKLSIIDMIPETCFYSNVRDHVSKEDWYKIRGQIISDCGGNCVVCGIKKAYSLEAHEMFEYCNGVQKLQKILPLCRECHLCQHPGYAGTIGKTKTVINKLLEVYNCTKTEAESILDKSFSLWEERSCQEWLLNLDKLKDFSVTLISDERILK